MKEYPQNVEPFAGNPYQKKRSWYDPKKGHTGRDLKYKTGDILLSPITGEVVKCLIQKEMGKTMYVKHDGTGDIHVFAHNSAFLKGKGDRVKRGDQLVITGNTGTKTTTPHEHYEIITPKPINKEDEIMWRRLNGFSGYNTDPIPYLQKIYKENHINFKTGKQEIPLPKWLAKIKYIPYPKWLR